MELSAFAYVPGRADGKDALVAMDQQHPFEKPAALIMEEIFIPAVFHELGNDYHNAAIRTLFGKMDDELH